MKAVIDPLATSGRISETYHRYLTSLLSLRDSRLATGLAEKISSGGSMTKGPYLDVTPPHEKGASLRDLVGEGILSAGFLSLCSEALPADRPLYVHQERAIRKAARGRSLVVATGTGSGKTESFLVPILDSLAREREAGTLGPGVRALLLYPMNALANDQVKRLREVLRDNSHITFGRYTGETPEDPKKARELFAQLNPGVDPISNELLSRAEMKKTPPHILLTNYAMLEYLLVRPLDTPLFDGALATSWRWLAVDEAHVYGGSQGAEIAMLLRRLQHRVSRHVPLQSILTSATVGDDPALVAEFATRLTRATVEWVQGNNDRCDVVPAVRRAVPERGAWGPLAGPDYSRIARSDDPAPGILRIAASQGWTGTHAGEALAHELRLVELKNHLASGPLTLNQIVAGLPDAGWTPESLTACVRVASGLVDAAGEPVLSARYHLFAKATEGAFSCLGTSGPHVALTRHESCPDCSDPMFEFGSCQRCGHIYLVGERDERDGRAWFRPTNRPGARAVWLLLDPPVDESAIEGPSDEDEEVLGEAQKSDHQDQWICSSCACLSPSGGCCPACLNDHMRPVRMVQGLRTEIKECLHCGSRNPDIRTFSTGNDAAAAVLSTALYQEVPSADDEASAKPGNGRKLLLFSDSRQSAAFFATYLEDTYDRIRRRALILHALRTGDPLNIEDLASEVAKRAGELGLFERKDSRQKRERTAALWVMQELLSLDERQSLQGLGQMVVRFGKDPMWRVPQPLLALGLTEQKAWDLVEILVTILLTQGAVTMPDDVQPNDEAFAPRLGPVFVRSTGSEAKRKILSWEPSRNSVTNRRVDFVKRVLIAAGAPAEKAAEVLNGVWKFLAGGMPDGWLAQSSAVSEGLLWRVDHTWLELRAVSPGEALYRCASCQRVASVSVLGICPTMGCDGRLEEWSLPSVTADSDHYRALHRNVLPVGMSVSEHTAQWQPRAAAKIQQDFINGDVNVLSCSTTFELGVDVGELEAVMLRNMPPSTANYVQRAGRAGRRASSAAVILTYAQRRPHDLARYQRPTEMIAGRVQAPYVYLDNDRIGRRHAHSVALSLFLRHALETTGTVWRRAGEFFAGDAPTGAERFAEFLRDYREQVCEAVVQVLSPIVSSVIGGSSGEWTERLIELLGSVSEEFQRDIGEFETLRKEAFEARRDSLASRYGKTIATLEAQELLGFLGQHNILPKYGFPVDTVDLRTIYADAERGADIRLSRDLSTAIYEYAPGAQVVAGGRLWTSGGIYRMPGRELVQRHYAACPVCGHYTDDVSALGPTCKACNHLLPQRPPYAEPVYGFLAARDPKRPGTTPPQRAWNGSTHVRRQSPQLQVTTLVLGEGQLHVAYGPRAELVAISEGKVGRGFLICDWCGWGTSLVNEFPKVHRHLFKGDPCKGPLRQLALGHTFETDMLTIAGPGNLAPLLESPSVLYAVLEGASRGLDISREDVDGTLFRAEDSSAALAFFDTVPGGAGNVLRIGQHLPEVLARALKVVSSCECGEETSCYACLRTFRNERFHDQLRRGEAARLLAQALRESTVVTQAPPPEVPVEWSAAMARAETPAEQEFLVTLAQATGIPLPEVGVEVADGIPVAFAWPDERVVVLMDAEPADRNDLERAGWMVVEAQASALRLALGERVPKR